MVYFPLPFLLSLCGYSILEFTVDLLYYHVNWIITVDFVCISELWLVAICQLFTQICYDTIMNTVRYDTMDYIRARINVGIWTPHLTHGSFGPRESTSQTTSRSDYIGFCRSVCLSVCLSVTNHECERQADRWSRYTLYQQAALRPNTATLLDITISK